MKKLNFLVAILASLFTLQFAWAQPGEYTVNAGGYYFAPASLTIESGSTVTWLNFGGVHDVNGESNSFDPGTPYDPDGLPYPDITTNPEPFSLPSTFTTNPDNPTTIGSYTFTTPGTYYYDCSIGQHALQGMVGAIIVTPPGEYFGCMDNGSLDNSPFPGIAACNFDPIANIDDGSCLYDNLCCTGLDLDCASCNACQTPVDFCLANPGYAGCDELEVVGCMDDGSYDWSPFPGIAADNYAPGANTPCLDCCAYWGCGNPDNSLMLTGTFMDLTATQNADGTWESNGWNGTSMLVTNVWDSSPIYELDAEVFYFSPIGEIMYELPGPPDSSDLSLDCCGGPIDETGSPNEEDADYNPNYGGPTPDGIVNHFDCLNCAINPDYEGFYGYVVNFCAPEDLLDGCYNLVVDNGDPSSIAWQIQNAEISVFALTGSANFDSTSGSACDDDNAGFEFSDVGIQSSSFDSSTGELDLSIKNYGTLTTIGADGEEQAGTTYILVDGELVFSDSPSELTTISPITNDPVTSNGYYLGSSYPFEYDLSEFTSASVLAPGDHTILVWVNGGESCTPCGLDSDFDGIPDGGFQESNYANNVVSIPFFIDYTYGCMDPFASNYNPEANSDDNGNEPCNFDSCEGPNQAFTITCGGGSWDLEVGWSIQTMDGFEVLSGDAPYNSSEVSESPYGICLAPGCYEIIMTDNFGDGWNGATLDIGNNSFSQVNNYSAPYTAGATETVLFEVGEGECSAYLGCTDPSAGNYDPNAIEDDGSCSYDCSSYVDDNGLAYESVQITVDGGSFQTEVVWEILNSSGVMQVSGSAPYASVECMPVGCYDVVMSDTWGDGWNNNTITLVTSYGSEFVFSGPSADLDANETVTETFATGNPNDCGIYFGCTDPTADNYDSVNTIDDGSCEWSCADGGTTTYINMTDSYGDGWNGNILTLTDADGNVIDLTIYDVNGQISSTVWTQYDGGSESLQILCLPDGCVSLDWTDGGYIYETAFTISDEDGNILASGEDGILSQQSFGINADNCYLPGCIDGFADNYNPDATEDDGSCEYTCDQEGIFLADISCDGGTWQGEVSWEIYDDAGNMVLTGGAPYTNAVCLVEDMCYEIVMYDSFGDGWNGNTLTIAGTQLTLPGGEFGILNYNCPPEECSVDLTSVSVANAEGTDFSFTITNSAGSIVAFLFGGGEYAEEVCLDPNDCYNVSLSSPGGNGDSGASVFIGEDEYVWGTFSSWASIYEEAFGNTCPILGCTDSEADNYDPDANTDDGSCINCGDDESAYTILMTDSWGDGWDSNNLTISSVDEVLGSFTITTGSSNSGSICLAPGCYEVSCDGGIDVFQAEVGWEILDSDFNVVLSGGAPYDYLLSIGNEDNCGDVFGCMDVASCNYDENALYDDGSCDYSCIGCTDSTACNYDETASIDSGLCWYDTAGYCCIVENFDLLDGGSVSTSNLFSTWSGTSSDDATVSNGMLMIDPNDDIITTAPVFDSGIYHVSFDMDIQDGGSGYFNMGNSGNPAAGWGWQFEVYFNTNETVTVIGTNVSESYNFGSNAVDIYVDLDNGFVSIEINGTCIHSQAWEGSLGGVNFFGATADSYGIDNFSICEENDATLCVLGCIDSTAFNYDENANTDDGSCVAVVEGCVDSTAFNYDENANTDDGSCFMSCTEIGLNEYSLFMYTNSWAGWYGNSITIDIDGESEVEFSLGDTFQETVSFCGDINTCMGITAGGGIFQNEIGWTIYDENGDMLEEGGAPYFGEIGLCVTPGCTDSTACNYNPAADQEDDSCEYAIDGYYCDGTCIDSDGDGVCNNDEVEGCTEFSAYNFNPLATNNDGSCEAVVEGCTDEEAGNYDGFANTDNGSCTYGPWDVSTTDCNMTVLLDASLVVTIENEEVTEAWIGALNSNGDIVGSAFWQAGEVNSIAVWGAEGDTPGMQPGELINWVVAFDNEDGYLNANCTFSFGDGIYSCQGLQGVIAVDAASSVTQTIQLNSGWGIWSTYVNPEDTDMISVFSNIVDNVTIVKDESGAVYWPAFGLNSIGSLTEGRGYQVKMLEADDLVLTGDLIPYDTTIELASGWGIMGYLHTTCYDAVIMMEPAVSSITIVKDESGAVYWPAFGLNSIGNMCDGKGYQIKMIEASTFSFPSPPTGGRFGDITLIEKTVHYETASNTGNNMTIGLPTTSWEVMPVIGDEIAAYDESGRLIGSTLFTGENIALTVWGDDLMTDAKDGLAIGEKVTFKLWNSDMNTESTLVVTKWDAGSDLYAIDGISVASNIILSGATSADTYKLYQNVPNPFNGTTAIKFYVPEDVEVQISVYNMLGEHVADVANDIFNTGKHEVTFNASNLGQGTYFVRMTTEGFTATKNMNIVK